jgi:hypothetical protein
MLRKPTLTFTLIGLTKGLISKNVITTISVHGITMGEPTTNVE